MAIRRKKTGAISAARVVIIAVVAASILKMFVIDLVIVRGESMSPTIGTGTVALVARCAFGIRSPLSGRYALRWAEPLPGDIVLVDPAPAGSRRAIKRVFETGPAFMRAESGILAARGGSVPLGPFSSSKLAGTTYVPAGRAFLTGDNGGSSFDSRDYGSVPIETIAGKV